MKNNSKLLVEICKDVISEMVENGFYEKNFSTEQLKKLNEIKERNKRQKERKDLRFNSSLFKLEISLFFYSTFFVLSTAIPKMIEAIRITAPTISVITTSL